MLGKEHPSTAASSNNGLMMKAIGDNVGALEMRNRALMIIEKELGKEHPATSICSFNAVTAISMIQDHPFL